MNIIELDANSWRSPSDFYEDVLKKIGAPSWHGVGVNALVDSIIFGGVNALSKPYTMRINNLDKANADVKEEVQFAFQALSGVSTVDDDGALTVIIG